MEGQWCMRNPLTKTAILKASDLPEEMQTRIFELSNEAVSNYKIEKDIATYLKKELDQLYGATWHVIVGKSFGSYVTHEQGFFTYFYIGQLAFLIFKSGWFFVDKDNNMCADTAYVRRGSFYNSRVYTYSSYIYY